VEVVTFLLGALVGLAVGIVGEGYWLMGRAQRLLTGQEHLQAAAERLLAAVPSKSAPRTDGSHEKPRAWWQKLVPEMVPDLPPTEPMAAAVDVGLAQILDQPAKRRHAAPTRRKP
jgi:hypothetical protein